MADVTYFCAINKFMNELRRAKIQKQGALVEELSVLRGELALLRSRKERVEQRLQHSQNTNALLHLCVQEGTEGLPDAFMCPITREFMREPVVLVESGQTYERAAIERWLESHRHMSDPLTNVALQRPPELVPNYALRRASQEFEYHRKAFLAGDKLGTHAPGDAHSHLPFTDNRMAWEYPLSDVSSTPSSDSDASSSLHETDATGGEQLERSH